jgi:FkbM family methyltransferase
VSDLRTLRFLRRWTLFKKADNLKRHHFSQQDAILRHTTRLGDLEAQHDAVCGEVSRLAERLERTHGIQRDALREQVGELTAHLERHHGAQRDAMQRHGSKLGELEEHLTRSQMAQQDRLRAQGNTLGDLERAAHSNLETEGALLLACRQILETLEDLRGDVAGVEAEARGLVSRLATLAQTSRLASEAQSRNLEGAVASRLSQLLETQQQTIHEMAGVQARATEEVIAGRLAALLEAQGRVVQQAVEGQARAVDEALIPRLAALLEAQGQAVQQAVEEQARAVDEVLGRRLMTLHEEQSRAAQGASAAQARVVEEVLVGRLALLLETHSRAVQGAGEAQARTVEEALIARLTALLETQGHLVERVSEAQARVIDEILTARIAALGEHATAEHARVVEETVTRPPRVIRTPEYAVANPEAGLLEHLYSCLPARVALDVGANRGELSLSLLDAGYEVFAFEPFPPVYEKLRERLGGRPAFHASPVAIAQVDGEVDLQLVVDTTGTGGYGDVTLLSSLILHPLPEGLVFSNSIRVSARSLDSLARAKEIPKDVALLKIDTEGYDLQVIRGMGDLQPAVVMAEFWDPAASLAGTYTLNRLDDLVGEMRRRGYVWHVVVYRVDGSAEVAFFANHCRSVAQSWGNVLFFMDHDVFREALRWCSSVLPQTYFTA